MITEIQPLPPFGQPVGNHKLQIAGAVQDRVVHTEAKIRAAYGALVRVNEVKTEIEKNDVEIKSLIEQLEVLRKGLKGRAPEEQEIVDQKAAFDVEETIIEDLPNSLALAQQRVQSLADDVGNDAQIETVHEPLTNAK